jgi:hypothetical protein
MYGRIESPVFERVRADGHTVEYVTEVSPGVSDNYVLNWANQNAFIFL